MNARYNKPAKIVEHWCRRAVYVVGVVACDDAATAAAAAAAEAMCSGCAAI